MDYATSMGFVQRIRNLRAEFQYLLQRQRTFFQALRQRLSLHALHHQVVHAILAAHVVQHANVRMIQARNGLGLAFESLLSNWITRKLYRKNLERHGAVQPRIPRPIHLSHATRAERRADLIRPELASHWQGHLFTMAGQLRTTDMGEVAASFTTVLIRNR